VFLDGVSAGSHALRVSLHDDVRHADDASAGDGVGDRVAEANTDFVVAGPSAVDLSAAAGVEPAAAAAGAAAAAAAALGAQSVTILSPSPGEVVGLVATAAFALGNAGVAGYVCFLVDPHLDVRNRPTCAFFDPSGPVALEVKATQQSHAMPERVGLGCSEWRGSGWREMQQ